MKKEKNLFSIGEIAKALGVTRRIILNYEQRGLIQPDIKEGTTGNRYYTIDSFTKLRSIRSFQNLGLSLDEIRTISTFLLIFAADSPSGKARR